MDTTSLEGRTLEEVKFPPQQGYALCIVEKDEDSENRFGETSSHSIRLRLLSRLCEATTTHIRRVRDFVHLSMLVCSIVRLIFIL
jgi:hypothetical protein